MSDEKCGKFHLHPEAKYAFILPIFIKHLHCQPSVKSSSTNFMKIQWVV